ncbi:MAG: hypothetical protein U0R79_03220 [Propionicimonas sp.]
MLPARIIAAPTPTEEEARLPARPAGAAAALGVFTPAWLAEYFYTDRARTTAALDRLRLPERSPWS